MARALGILIVLLAIVFVVVQLLRPVPGVRVSASTVSVRMPGTPAGPVWPAAGESAVGVVGTGVLETHGAQVETPIASLTKMMTAYVVLQDHPLSVSSNGPNLAISSQDVTVYQNDQAAGDSVVAVQAGEQLSERQALEALLIPSGDNIAALLADWDAGSEGAFVAKMNVAAKQMGLAHTHYVDASGVTAGTVSTATDQLRLAMAAMGIPVFRSIVAMAQVTLPVAGVQYNVNSQLGTNGVVGIKTGYTPAAGACFVFAATAPVGGQTDTVVGSVLGQGATPGHPSALTNVFTASQALLTSTTHLLERATVLRAGSPLGHLDAPWAKPVALDALHSVSLTGFPGQAIRTQVVLPRHMHAPIAGGRPIGTAVVGLTGVRTVRTHRSRLAASRKLGSASIMWRLTHL